MYKQEVTVRSGQHWVMVPLYCDMQGCPLRLYKQEVTVRPGTLILILRERTCKPLAPQCLAVKGDLIDCRG